MSSVSFLVCEFIIISFVFGRQYDVYDVGFIIPFVGLGGGGTIDESSLSRDSLSYSDDPGSTILTSSCFSLL